MKKPKKDTKIKIIRLFIWIMATYVILFVINLFVDARKLDIILFSSVTVINLILILFYTKRIFSPLSRLNKYFIKTDYNEKINTQSFGKLKGIAESIQYYFDKVNFFLYDMNNTIDFLTESLDQIASISVKFSEDSQSQAGYTEEIMATVEEISSEMDTIAESADVQSKNMASLSSEILQMSDNVKQINSDVQSMSRLTNELNNVAEEGKRSIEKLSGSMEMISKSSREVSGVVEIINDISDRINLLSLNAAIEAARAGESGRGFAVVADEISKLAEATASSIKNIEGLITRNDNIIKSEQENIRKIIEIIADMAKGNSDISVIADQIFDSMKEQVERNQVINNDVSKFKEMSDKIKSITDEHKTAVQEISNAITSVDEKTQAHAENSRTISNKLIESSSIARAVKDKAQNF